MKHQKSKYIDSKKRKCGLVVAGHRISKGFDRGIVSERDALIAGLATVKIACLAAMGPGSILIGLAHVTNEGHARGRGCGSGLDLEGMRMHDEQLLLDVARQADIVVAGGAVERHVVGKLAFAYIARGCRGTSSQRKGMFVRLARARVCRFLIARRAHVKVAFLTQVVAMTRRTWSTTNVTIPGDERLGTLGRVQGMGMRQSAAILHVEVPAELTAVIVTGTAGVARNSRIGVAFEADVAAEGRAMADSERVVVGRETLDLSVETRGTDVKVALSTAVRG